MWQSAKRLQQELKIYVNPALETQWNAREEAVKDLDEKLDELWKQLNDNGSTTEAKWGWS